jgi:LPS export ABC transporter protein LptC
MHKRVKVMRRFLIALIAAVLLAVAVNWIQTWRMRARMVQETAQILSSEMIRSADQIEYSENENGVARFKLRAKKLLETREGKSLLEGIEARDFNPDGAVRNLIRSRNAEYDREGKRVSFKGDVEIEMGEGARLRTQSLKYDLQNNVGSSDEQILFETPQAKGVARGAWYDNAREILELKGDLDFTLQRTVAQPDGSGKAGTVRVTSNQGYYSEPDSLIIFRGDAVLESSGDTLAGSEIVVRFTPDRKHLTSLLCQGNAVYRSGAPDERTIAGDRVEFGISDAGVLERILVTGNASFASNSEDTGQELTGSTIRIDLDAEKGTPNRIESQGGVQFRITRGSKPTAIAGNQLEARFARGESLLENLRVWEGARMTMGGSDAGAEDRLDADELNITFRAAAGRSAPHVLRADRKVRWISRGGGDVGGSGRSLAASALRMQYGESGDSLESGDATGGVVLEGLPGAGGDGIQVRKLHADTVHFLFYPADNKLREFRGDGNVRVYYSRPADPAREAPAEEFQTSSASIKATFMEHDGAAETVSQWGGFTFNDGSRTATSGRSDYDARKEMLVLTEAPLISVKKGVTTGDRVQYNQGEGILSVQKRVRSVLNPQSAASATPFSSPSGSSSPTIVTADAMQYWTGNGRALYTGSVQMLSENGQLQARELEIIDSGEQVKAREDVRHLIPRRQAVAGAAKAGDGDSGTKPPEGGKSAAPVTIRSTGLEYAKHDNAIHYSGGVNLTSDDITMVSDTLDATFDRAGNRLETAIAKGKLQISQRERSVEGLQAEYLVNAGKVVVTGSPAHIKDPERGNSQAPRLTFFTADDRILLEKH